MKKRVLFVLPSFGIGGTTLSTYNIVTLLDKGEYDISILPMYAGGLLKSIYDEIGYIKPSYFLNTISTFKKEKYNFLLNKITYLIWLICSKFYCFNAFFQRIEAKKLSHNNYDIVVACQEGFCTDFARRIKSKKHIAWFRCEFNRYHSLIKRKNNFENVYSSYDKIVGVSENTITQFRDYYPLLTEKLIAINNPQNEKFILKQADNDDHDSNFIKDGFNLVSVGRIDPVKRFVEIPQIAKTLLDKGLKFNWYIIGDGDEIELNKIKNNIEENNVGFCVKLLGAKSNVHYYIKNSELLICLSSSEACPRVINEAKILHVPVICTDFSSAHEFIESGKNGIICTIDEIADNVFDLIQNRALYKKIQDNIAEFRFDNSEILKKINELFN